MTEEKTASLSRKEREFQRREEEILKSAVRLFEGEDWEQVTVAQIAQEADIGKGTVYKHFSSKEDIYARVALDFHEQLMGVFEGISKGQGVLAFMREAISESFKFYQRNNVCAKLSSFCKRSDFKRRISEQHCKEYEHMDQRFELFFGEILQAGIDEGVIQDQPIIHLMIGLEATFEGAISMMMNDSYTDFSELDEEQFVEVLTGFMINALARSPVDSMNKNT